MKVWDFPRPQVTCAEVSNLEMIRRLEEEVLALRLGHRSSDVPLAPVEGHEERELIEKLQHQLEIPGDEAMDIFEEFETTLSGIEAAQNERREAGHAWTQLVGAGGDHGNWNKIS